MWQLQLTPFSPTDEAIAVAIVEAIDESGILTVSCEDIVESFNQNSDEEEIELDEVEAVLKRFSYLILWVLAHAVYKNVCAFSYANSMLIRHI
eukprot:TRINITY_DN4000_c0_g1_i1.p1 TRINITY_DN4000_c0_g1~~TRINITY_DN4000_c0_g1_i1.p1  ORF type:complete len:101 (-),score=12.54 TRINITY_DN4000_c0_g1_i1:211-489(-)